MEGTEALDRTVLDSATRAFLADGYAATSMERIARMVGCSKATVYRRHHSKEDLFRAVVRERCRHLFDAMHEASLSPPIRFWRCGSSCGVSWNFPSFPKRWKHTGS
ncbi:TetR/AcrR family transcriptional regulator [Komagataeibacter rhaeticus]|nr:TetR/AcrR family transcriptional regulator [Komagataeibacter rhaeticus]